MSLIYIISGIIIIIGIFYLIMNEEIKFRTKRVAEEVKDIADAVKEIAEQSDDIINAAKGEKRKGRKNKE